MAPLVARRGVPYVCGMRARPFYHRETEGIRVTVRPLYVREHSRPHHGHYVFAYFVRLENVGSVTAQLVTRRWHIHDEAGKDSVVEGDGVIGEQPTLARGAVHEYQSFCILTGPLGWMEGHYHFVRADGSAFDAIIPRFVLDATVTADPLS
jgi:ApaG protein